jgi:hypothetical protein
MKKLWMILAIVLLAGVCSGSQIAAAEPEGKGKTATSGHETKGRQMGGTDKGHLNEPWHLSRASEIIGSTIKDDRGENVGTVIEIVITQNGQAQYLVLSLGGVLGIGKQLVPIPYQTARWDVKDRDMKLGNIDKQGLEKAPNFSDDQWHKVGEAEFNRSVYGYYRCQQPGAPGEPCKQEQSGEQEPEQR